MNHENNLKIPDKNFDDLKSDLMKYDDMNVTLQHANHDESYEKI